MISEHGFIPAFNERHIPRRIKGFPEPVFFMVLSLPALIAGVVLAPFPLWVLSLVLIVAVFMGVYHVYQWYDLWQVRTATMRGQDMKKLPSWGRQGKKAYIDGFPWISSIGEHGLVHDEGIVSLAVAWAGIQQRNWDMGEYQAEQRRRIGMIKGWSDAPGIVVENHLIRSHDSRVADAYLAEGGRMAERMGHPLPPIVADIRQQVAERYRPLARTNRVVTVFSLGEPAKRGLLSFLKPQAGARIRSARQRYARLLAFAEHQLSNLPGGRILSFDEYQRQIQSLRGGVPGAIDWRFNLAEQLIREKPEPEDDCMNLNGRYYRSCLVQNYPAAVPVNWVMDFCQMSVDLHVSQVIIPKLFNEAVDRSAKDSESEGALMSGTKGKDQSLHKLSTAQQYREHLVSNGLPVADNALVVTFSGDSPKKVSYFAERFKRDLVAQDGLVRDSLDIQAHLFEARLPGMGRNLAFAREDHGELIAATMPVATFDEGETQRPESLRLASSGNLVGFSPSRLGVPHELVVAKTGTGKDTQFGLRLLETYPYIRYDVVEMGNSYQGVIEAIGGKYCRAREQVINPFASYQEFQRIVALSEAGSPNLDRDFIRSQSDVLQPIFKGMDGPQYTQAERNRVEAAVRSLYESPDDRNGPVLPDLYEALDKVEATSDLQLEAKKALRAELYEFLSGETGQAFQGQDQFEISTVANALDFGGLTGELLQYYMTFMVVRVANNAMSRGLRSQVVLNEYKMLQEAAKEPIRWITFTLDRMGRKEWVGLTRITQGLDEIRSVDSEAISSIPNRTLLSRDDEHQSLGAVLDIPPSLVEEWKQFVKPEDPEGRKYRQALVRERGRWYSLHLEFPKLLLDLMDTSGDRKALREEAYRRARDPYERIEIYNQLVDEKERSNGSSEVV